MKGKIILFPIPKNKKLIELTEEMAINTEKPIEDAGMVRAAWELYYWQYANSDCFTAKLFSLIAKSDMANRGRLMLGFQDEVIVFVMWEQSETPKAFFDMFNIKINGD